MINQRIKQIIHFATANQQELVLNSEDITGERTVAILIDLGFEYGEEQVSDGVTYSQFHHDLYDSIMLKQGMGKSEYVLLRG